MNAITKLICTVIEIFALVSFKDERMIVQFPLVMAIFTLLFFASLVQSGTVLRNIQDLVEMPVGISPAVAIDKSVLSEGFVANNRVRTRVLFEIGVEEKTKFVEVLAVGTGEHLELTEKLAIVEVGKVFAPIFLLFSHLI